MTNDAIAHHVSCNADSASVSRQDCLAQYCPDAGYVVSTSRSEIIGQLRSYLQGIKPFYSQLGSRVELSGAGVSYEMDTISMEAFARPLWGLASAWAGGDELDDWARLYRTGLIAGTNPNCAEYWGDCHDYDQKFVEMAAIAYALLMAPNKLWLPLADDERATVAAWLNQINNHGVWDNNWLFFPVLVNLALRSLGMPFNESVMRDCLIGIDRTYFHGGWYTDGPRDGANANMDYYNPFAFHFYGLIYAIFAYDSDPKMAHKFIERAQRFSQDFAGWFSGRGESVPFGRSLTYRFAQSAFFSIAAVAEIRLGGVGFDLAQALTLVARNLAFWSQLPVKDNAGVLQVGYHYPNLHMQEGYNAPGSPMWSLKAFALLAIPASNDFWVQEFMPRPLDSVVRPTAASTMLLQRERGEAVIYTGGRIRPRRFTHCEEKYCKFAYSSRWGFSISISPYSLKESAPDSMLAFEEDGLIRVRSKSLSSEVTDDAVISEWIPCRGVRVRTELRPCHGGCIRIHQIESDSPHVAYDCGFAIPAESVEEADGICMVGALPESDLAGEAVSFRTEPNTNIMCPKTVIHAVRYEIPRGSTRLVTWVSND